MAGCWLVEFTLLRPNPATSGPAPSSSALPLPRGSNGDVLVSSLMSSFISKLLQREAETLRDKVLGILTLWVYSFRYLILPFLVQRQLRAQTPLVLPHEG